ncbi:MAG: hypothetical protein HWQ23_26160 [Nostoc sp. JL33]|uniref:hypothetical protein n=1 Tax=Nostoc sp. JL33 TaxID=2815396 RepID=UPI0025D3F3F1|nr:hypothetical protein [Nostoc sp. JL33]MBN3873625.1 hypothetical protein [Nostoc sp. JL33]
MNWEFLKYVWSYPINRRPGILEKLSQLTPNQQVIILCEPTEVRDFLQITSHNSDLIN